MRDQRARAFIAAVDAVIMIGITYEATGLSGNRHPILWGAALAAVVCAIVVFANGPAVLAWVALGFILFGGLFAPEAPNVLMVALALALIPLVPRPRGSLAAGVAIAAVVAVGTPLALRLLS